MLIPSFTDVLGLKFIHSSNKVQGPYGHLKSKVNRYLQGCDTFMSLGRADFLREKSQIFSVAPWSNERVDELSFNLKEGVAKLTSEGLSIKENLRNSNLSELETQNYMNQINHKISSMDRFVQTFLNY